MMETIHGKIQDLDWLCIAPHPDDAEIGAGGTLIRLAMAGKKVGILELSRGEMGTQGTPAERIQECKAAAEIMHLTWRGTLNLKDGALNDTAENTGALASALRMIRPSHLLIPHVLDRHPDHYGSYALCKRAIHRAGLQKENLIGEIWRVPKVWMYQGNSDITPHFVVDVSEYLAQWEAAILAHHSQFAGQAVSETVNPEIIERRKARLGYWGTLARVRYAEAFESEGLMALNIESL